MDGPAEVTVCTPRPALGLLMAALFTPTVAALAQQNATARPWPPAIRLDLAPETEAATQDSGESEDDQALAEEVTNPVPHRIVIPIFNDFNYNLGPGDDGFRYVLDLRPVIPIPLNKDWDLMSRTIAQAIYQDDAFPRFDPASRQIVGSGAQFGLADTLQTFYLSPRNTGPVNGGVGPALLLPTATNDLLGLGKWGAGPTAELFVNADPFTFAVVANHIWSFAGDQSRPNVSASGAQAVIAYTTPSAFTLTLVAEPTYNWSNDQWNVPVGLLGGQLFRVGKQAIIIQAGPRYWVERPDFAPEWGFRVSLTWIFPK